MNKLFLINTRAWLAQLRVANPEASLLSAGEEFWLSIKNKGFDGVWLLGIWDNAPTKLQGQHVATKYIDQYRKILPDITEGDIVDSCFAINDYTVSLDVGSREEVLELKEMLNQYGLKLILDFVPNHFHYYSDLITENRDVFIHGNQTDLNALGIDCYELGQDWIAHGRDPYTGSWSDTAQINWLSSKAHEFMTSKLESVAEICDGVRCDMAMAILPEAFEHNWGHALNKLSTGQSDQSSWWETVIPHIRNIKGDFTFIGECYWELQASLLDSGFDFVYDKDFYDCIITHDVPQIKTALLNKPHLPHSVIFLDNHDEQRSAARLTPSQIQPAAILQAALPGLKLYYQGQEEGSKVTLPMQISRGPYEQLNQEVYDWYQNVFEITKDPVFVLGDFELVDPIDLDDQNQTSANLVAFKRTYKQKTYIVVVNYSLKRSKGFIPFVPEINDRLTKIVFEDKLTGQSYEYTRNLLMTHHLYVELAPWQSHVFEVREEV
jgi:hypothetical protein